MVCEETKDGCVREINEDLFIRYYHQLKEVWPFALKSQNKKIVDEEYKKTIAVLDEVYNSPCTKQYGKGFKAMTKTYF